MIEQVGSSSRICDIFNRCPFWTSTRIPSVLSKFFVVFLSPRQVQCQYLKIMWQLFPSNILSYSYPWLCSDSTLNKTRNIILYIFAEYRISIVLSFNFTPFCHVSSFRSCLHPDALFCSMNMVDGNKYAHLKHSKKCVVNFDFVLRCYEVIGISLQDSYQHSMI